MENLHKMVVVVMVLLVLVSGRRRIQARSQDSVKVAEVFIRKGCTFN
jgi:hypothetical protein